MLVTSVRGILPEASSACLAERDIPGTTGRDRAMCHARTCQRVVQTSRRSDAVASRPRISWLRSDSSDWLETSCAALPVIGMHAGAQCELRGPVAPHAHVTRPPDGWS